MHIQSNLSKVTTPGTGQKWSPWTGGLLGQVIYISIISIGTTFEWSLWAGGLLRQVVPRTGLTVVDIV